MRKKPILCIIVFLILIVLIVLPGIFSSYIISHEFYHIMAHKESAEALCFDINNPPYVAHVLVNFDNNGILREYVELEEGKEERIADTIGDVFSLAYIVFSIVAIFLIAWIVTDNKPIFKERIHRVRRHVRKHIRRIRKKVRRKKGKRRK